MADTLARPPAHFDRILAKRALLCALGPLAGLRAEGNVTATASGSPVVLPAFTYGIPIIGNKATYDRMLKTTAAVTVTSAGVAVPVRSVGGGPGGNLPAGTVILWQPLPDGIVARGVVDGDAITGGLAQPGPGRCARVVAFDTLGREDALRTVWEAKGEGYPAIILARTSSVALEQGTVASTLRRHTFRVFVVTQHWSGNDERQEEGELLLDAIESTLDGLEDVEGDVFSGPPVECMGEAREASAPSAHVFSLEVNTYHALKRIDVRLSDGVSWQPWATTQIQLVEPAATPLEAKAVVDLTVEHEQ